MPSKTARRSSSRESRGPYETPAICWPATERNRVNDIIYILISLGVFLGVFAAVFGFEKV
jgi:hypothetical protein